MKILMVSSSMGIGGAETHIATLCGSLIKKGAEVDIMSEGGEFTKKCREAGAGIIYAPFLSKNPVKLIKCVFLIRKLSGKYDVIHVHSRLPALLAKLALTGKRIPMVTTAHCAYRGKGLRAALSCWGSAVLAVSEDIETGLVREFSLDPGKIVRTVNGIDTELFAPNSEKPRTGIHIIHVSRIDKNSSVCAFALLDCAEELIIKYGCRISIAGDGELFPELVRKWESLPEEVKEHIALLGRRTDISRILSDGDIFVGVSRAALEAASSALQVILAGNEGYGGILTTENFSDNARSNFCARSNGSTTAEKLIADLRSLLSGNGPDRAERIRIRDLIAAFYSPERMAEDALRAYRMAKKSESMVLLGYYGFGNCGDDAILAGITSALLQTNICKIYVIVSNSCQNKGSGKIVYIKRYSLLRIINALRSSAYFALGGGNLLQNETSSRSLWYYGFFFSLSSLFGCRRFIISGGIGALHGKRARHKVSQILKSADFVGMRTRADILASRLLGQSDAVYMPDPAFYYLYGCAEKNVPGAFSSATGEPFPRRLLAVVPRGGEDLTGIKKLMRSLPRLSEFSIIYILMFPEEDAKAAAELYDDFGGKIIRSTTPEGTVSLLTSAELTIASRLHGAIFSVCAGTPTVLLGPGKRRNFAREIKLVCGSDTSANVIEAAAFFKAKFESAFDKLPGLSES